MSAFWNGKHARHDNLTFRGITKTFSHVRNTPLVSYVLFPMNVHDTQRDSIPCWLQFDINEERVYLALHQDMRNKVEVRGVYAALEQEILRHMSNVDNWETLRSSVDTITFKKAILPDFTHVGDNFFKNSPILSKQMYQSAHKMAPPRKLPFATQIKSDGLEYIHFWLHLPETSNTTAVSKDEYIRNITIPLAVLMNTKEENVRISLLDLTLDVGSPRLPAPYTEIPGLYDVLLAIIQKYNPDYRVFGRLKLARLNNEDDELAITYELSQTHNAEYAELTRTAHDLNGGPELAFNHPEPEDRVHELLSQFVSGSPDFCVLVSNISPDPYVVCFKNYRKGTYDVEIHGNRSTPDAGILLRVRNDTLIVDSFFFAVSPEAKESFRRDPWYGFGKRGMRLIDWVKHVTRCTLVRLHDEWRGKHRENSQQFADIFKAIRDNKKDQNEFYLKDPKYYETLYSSFDPVTRDNIIKDGYYAQYNFKTYTTTKDITNTASNMARGAVS